MTDLERIQAMRRCQAQDHERAKSREAVIAAIVEAQRERYRAVGLEVAHVLLALLRAGKGEVNG